MKPWHAYIPRPIIRATYNGRNQFRAVMFKRMCELVRLDYELSGLSIKIENHSDWIIYNEIFVKGVYDPAIRKLMEVSAGRPVNIVDLGANVGFFALRIAYLMAQQQDSRDFKMTLVEGSPLVYKDLVARIDNEPLLKEKVTTVFGLVGRRKGSAKIFESASFGAGNSLFATRIPAGVEVPFVDLAPLYNGGIPIDLLKCDIEGSELSFLENYGDMLGNVRAAVFEFHPDVCDVAKCHELLHAAGFMSNEGAGDIRLFWR